jgi:restriction system protein
MLPLLRWTTDNQEHSLAEAREHLAQELGLTDHDRAQLLPSGRQTILANRVAWAKVYLTAAGLLSATRRGYFKIAPKGLQVLHQPPERITLKFLDQFPEFLAFQLRRKKNDAPEEAAMESTIWVLGGLLLESQEAS